MKKVNSNLNTKETSEVGAQLINLSTKRPIAEDAYFELTYRKLSEKNQELTQAINRGQLQSDLREKDDFRDLDVRAIFYTVEAYCIRRPSEGQQKAVRIMEILNRYGINLTEASYTSESASVRSLLLDLKAPELAEDRSSIPDLDSLIANLEGSQGAFDNSKDNLRNEGMERKASKSATVLAKEVKDIINDELCNYASAMSNANPEKYAVFAKEFFEIIEKSNKEVHDRLAALKRKKEEAEKQTEQES